MHDPVMLTDVLNSAGELSGKRVVDCTFGGGGYTKVFLDRGASVVAIDKDPSAIERSKEFVSEYGDKFRIHHGSFRELDDALAGEVADVIVADLGISSFQIDQAERGFSFMKDGPLDMRMSADGLSAADVVADFEEERLANIIYMYGEERLSRRIAKAIVRARSESRIETTTELVKVIESAVGRPKGKKSKHPAMRTFMALRLFVNQELEDLEVLLEKAMHSLSEDGKLIIVTFHSLEDRIVKQFMHRFKTKPAQVSEVWPEAAASLLDKVFVLPTRKSVKVSEEEVKNNRRARSAQMRVLERVA
ncbi:MAG: 16S rRNA (cytosine(1402)-N(4))-methyltransferase RsmH [Pseudomonadota bacterium]|nr:16S rRNA (cytosine(1402)-N(4))-methyltransferase RsmH [Pseudomonadota bacterium]